MDEGLPTPELDDMPQVPSSLLWVIEDFSRLESERSVGMGVGRIPVAKMYEYMERTETDPLLWDECIAYWSGLDNLVIENYAEKSKLDDKGGGKQKLGGGRNIVRPEDYPEG